MSGHWASVTVTVDTVAIRGWACLRRSKKMKR